MENQNVSLEELYHYLVFFKKSTDENFKAVYQRLDFLDKRIDQLERRVTRIEEKIENLEGKVQELYNKRDKVNIEWSRRLIFGTGLLAGIISYFVALFTGKYEVSL
ncbi:hypothetical protein HY604_04050 [Candidatus Peregrinibacteria bacterium]|nr:hypothetical protein [Candidatus Peregrinibacteria bacterium]